MNQEKNVFCGLYPDDVLSGKVFVPHSVRLENPIYMSGKDGNIYRLWYERNKLKIEQSVRHVITDDIQFTLSNNLFD